MLRSLMFLLMIWLSTQTTSLARTWYITPDGLGDAATIKAGVDSATAGDTVLVACGIYYESGISMKSGVVLHSETGEADCATIDANHVDRCLFSFGCDSITTIRGFTFVHGYPLPPHITYGGGIRCEDSYLAIVDCVITDNYADSGGGLACLGGSPRFERCVFSENVSGEGAGVLCIFSSPTFTNCLFVKNWAQFRGGGLWCEVEASPVLTQCTFYRNAGDEGGGGIYCFEGSSPRLENTIIAYSSQGEAISREHEDCEPILLCCDIYGNAGGDWVGFIADQFGTSGNFSADPRFCNVEGGDFTVENCSPCLPGEHPDGYSCHSVVGCYGAGCGCGEVTRSVPWGSIKSHYR